MSDVAGYTLENNQQVAAFRERHPSGYTILNGDCGVGLIGSYADEARAANGNAKMLQALADKIK